MKMMLGKDIVSLTDFARRTRQHTKELKEHNRPRVLTHNGRAAAVVLSVAAYEELAHQAEEYRLDLQLRAGLEAYDRGQRGRPLDEAFAEMRAELFPVKSVT